MEGLEIYGDAQTLQLSANSMAMTLKRTFNVTLDTSNRTITYAGQYGEVVIWPAYSTSFQVSDPNNLIVFTAPAGTVDTVASEVAGLPRRDDNPRLLGYPYLVTVARGVLNNVDAQDRYVVSLMIDPNQYTQNSFTLTVYEYTFAPVTMDNCGLQIFKADGSLAFDSSLPMLNIAYFNQLYVGTSAYSKYNTFQYWSVPMGYRYADPNRKYGVVSSIVNMTGVITVTSYSGTLANTTSYITTGYYYFGPTEIVYVASVIRSGNDPNTPDVWDNERRLKIVPKLVQLMVADITTVY